MDLYLDAEWFIGGEIFLLGWSRDRRQFGQLYDDTLTLDQFQELLDDTTGIIFFYGPDIGIIEKHFGIDIRTMYHCVNLLKVFKDNLPGLSNYKLATIEKLYGIKRNRQEYKANIFSIFKDWRNPQVKSLVLQYNREDVINLAKLKAIIFAQYDVEEEYLLQVRLAGTGPVELIKNYVYLLPADVYRGKYFNRGTTGQPENDPNITAQMVIKAKFEEDRVSLYRMIVLMTDVVSKFKFDVITSVNGRDSKFHLAGALAQGIANRLKTPYQVMLGNNNTTCSPAVSGKRILIVDDVIYKGRTMQAAIQAAMYQRPDAIYFLAFGKSKRFAY
jgi:RNase_H superfamily/Phosphoribosyl transferase domain